MKYLFNANVLVFFQGFVESSDKFEMLKASTYSNYKL